MTYDPNPRFEPDINPRCPGCGAAEMSDCQCGDEDSDPGPHTCIYVGVDDRDECEICGRDSDPFRDLHNDLGGEGGGA